MSFAAEIDTLSALFRPCAGLPAVPLLAKLAWQQPRFFHDKPGIVNAP